jgi:hypothetical protein
VCWRGCGRRQCVLLVDERARCRKVPRPGELHAYHHLSYTHDETIATNLSLLCCTLLCTHFQPTGIDSHFCSFSLLTETLAYPLPRGARDFPTLHSPSEVLDPLHFSTHTIMAPPGRRRAHLSPATVLLGLVFLFSSTASAASAVLGVDLGTEYIKAALVKPGIPLEIVLTKDSKRPPRADRWPQERTQSAFMVATRLRCRPGFPAMYTRT